MEDTNIFQIIGYHVNDKERCYKFIEEREYLISSKDKHWLGDGMYFWDNKSSAKYWLKEKRRKESNKEHIAISANISIHEENLLDVSDEETENILELLWNEFCKKTDCSKSKPLGIKINNLISYFEELREIKVIRGIGDYDKYTAIGEKRRFVNPYKNIKPKIRGRLRVIYCVRDFNLVSNRSIRSDINEC